MTWDVPTKDDCPTCGNTMFKKSGRGQRKPFCINENCANFTPEDKRGGYKKKTAETSAQEVKAEESKTEEKPKKKRTSQKKTADE